MFRFAVFSAVLALAFGQTKFCCTPDQWSGYIGEIIGSASGTTTHLTQGNINMTYDYTNKRLATTSNLQVDDQPTSVKVIMDYQKKMMYTIIDSQCTKSSLTGNMMKLCVPDISIPSGTIMYGFGANSLIAQSYFVPVSKDTRVVVTTTDTSPCVPIGEVLYGTVSGARSVQTMGYYNITQGITDPSVFIPPSSCSGQIFPKPAPVIKHSLLNYVHSKFANPDKE